MSTTLLHGDCLDLLPTLPDASVDAVICDPPYGTTACKWDSPIPFAPMWAELKRLIKPRGAVVLFGSQPFTSALVMSNPGWFKYEWVWDKVQVSGFLNAKFQPLGVTESVLIFGEGRTKYNPQMTRGDVYKVTNNPNPTSPNYGTHTRERKRVAGDQRYPKTLLQFSHGRSPSTVPLHPTQKPVALLEYLVRTYTDPGDVVLDFTMGSGTTGVACVNLNRAFIGIEKDAGYFATAERRIAEAQAAARQLPLGEVAA